MTAPAHTAAQDWLLAASRIRRDGQRAGFDDTFVDLVGDVVIPVPTFATEDGSVHVNWGARNLLREAYSSPPSAGLLDLAKHLSRQAGVELDVSGSSALVKSLDPPIANNYVHVGLTEFVRNHVRGRLLVHRGVRVSAIIAGLATAFPDARLMVLASTQAAVDHLDRQVRAVDPTLGRRLDQDEGSGELRLCLWFQAADVDFRAYDLVLVLDARQICHKLANTAMKQTDARFRLFGIESPDWRLAPSEVAKLMAAFGPEIYEIPADRTEAAQVELEVVSVNPPPLSADLTGVELHRQGNWKHPIRNRRIARLARALHDGNTDVLAGQARIHDWCTAQGSHPRRTIVRCASVEQILGIQRHLPTATLDTVIGDVQLRRLPCRQRRIIELNRTSEPSRLVLCDHDAPCFNELVDVVIWAAGGPGIVQGLFGSKQPHRRRLLLIDFKDQHHHQLRRWSGNRWMQYFQRGWGLVGCGEAFTRSVCFIHQFKQIKGQL